VASVLDEKKGETNQGRKKTIRSPFGGKKKENRRAAHRIRLDLERGKRTEKRGASVNEVWKSSPLHMAKEKNYLQKGQIRVRRGTSNIPPMVVHERRCGGKEVFGYETKEKGKREKIRLREKSRLI